MNSMPTSPSPESSCCQSSPMKFNTKTFLLAAAVTLSIMLAAFVVSINSQDEPVQLTQPEFVLSTLGPTRAYAGHGLYFVVSGSRAGGNPENTYITVLNKPAGVASSLPDISRTC